MAGLVLMAIAAAAAAAQPGPDGGYGPPPLGMAPPPPMVRGPGAPPPGVTWRETAPGARRYVVAPPPGDAVPGVRTRTWVQPNPPAPPHPGMAGGMHHYDGPPPPMDGGRWDRRDGQRRHVEIRRYGPRYMGPPLGWQGGYGVEGGYGMDGGYAMEGAPLPPPPPCPNACPPRPMPYGYGYGYGAPGPVIVTETTVTEPAVVERRVYYTTVRERVRVVRRHHRPCRCKLVKVRPSAGERG